ncbi:unnamed protein product [Peronospora belbahrii]|uniref:Sugar transporter SWEET1 n=1 Tax=Peronospora belbahrii TaxID=622444 RepID=A0AAU9KR28_9STRA|nr:unnamed protein product [Peronospora belbahrii]
MGFSALATLLHLTTAAIQIGMNLSPAPDMYRVHKSKTTGQMALLPLVLMCFNNHLWLLYGLLTGNIFPLCATALVGEIAGVIFTSIYYRWARNILGTQRICAVAFFGMAVVTMYVLLGVTGKTGQTYDQVVSILGYVGATINTCMYASPLATIKVVVETKSSASLPINLCVMIFLNCCMWSASSLVDNDMFVLIPSVIGLVFSGVQIPLYFIYRPVDTYMDRNAQLEQGYGTSTIKTVEIDTKGMSPMTYRTVRPSCVARFAGYQYQRAEGTPVMVASTPSYSGAEKSQCLFDELSMTPTPGSMYYTPVAYDEGDLEMQPLFMTPIAAETLVV